MTAINIVLNDAAGTPVAHTFVPVGLEGNTFWWEDQSAASVIGNWKISAKIQRPTNAQAGQNSKDRMFRVTVGLHEPVLETLGNSTISGIPAAPTIAYVDRVLTEYVIAERSTLQNRKDLRKMNFNLQDEAQVVAAVETLISSWS
jgi:hypothetical protein